MLETNADDVADELLDEYEEFAEERNRALSETKELARRRVTHRVYPLGCGGTYMLFRMSVAA